MIDLTVREFITKLASPSDGPGGGSASALMALSGIALLQMVSGRVQSPFSQQELASFAEQLIKLIDEDQLAFAAVVALRPQPNETGDSPDANFEQAVVYAIEVPFAVVKVCMAGLLIALQAITTIDSILISEVVVAAEALQAGGASSIMNMKVNISLLQSPETVVCYAPLIEKYREQGQQLLSTIYQQAAASKHIVEQDRN